MTKDEALKIAIEALDTLMMEKGSIYQKALQACKEALKQPSQEPVLLNVKTHDDKTYKVEVSAPSWQGNKEFVGLSDDEIFNLSQQCDLNHILGLSDYGRAIEQALKEKNT